MLRGNLSTRPFYNERLASFAIATVAAGALLLTAYNGTQLFTLSSERRDLRTRIERDQSDAAKIRTEAGVLQRAVDQSLLGRLAASTGEANDLIDQRTFSWTVFFGLIEQTLPLDVRLVTVSPRVERGVFKVDMTVVARDLTDVATFVDALLETGKFYDAAPLQQQRRDDGTYTAVIGASYLSPRSGVKPVAVSQASAPAAGPPR